MANDIDRHARIGLTSRYLESGGKPVIPVAGEIHYSRLPRDRWVDRLRLARSGGITIVSSYMFWLHHEPIRGELSFEGNLDVRAFIEEAARAGMDFVLRIGPWVHGEARNGGLPDWVLEAGPTRRDDPGYLSLVAEWYRAIAKEVGPLLGPDSPVVGIQLENELYDQPSHLLTLKRLARDAGLAAPLWTATAWGSAQLPLPEVLPQFGGYGDGMWVDTHESWHPTFRAHYFFSRQWDDPGIGEDVRSALGGAAAKPAELNEPSPDFPIATCELGGGMATAYHRRPAPNAEDIATVGLVKIGSGSAWQGYYMYAGGTNPHLPCPAQESHTHGYPNDLQRYGYDFHAPISEAGHARRSHALLRAQHALLEAFGDRLALMPAALPDVLPAGVEDCETLRWAVRAADGSGFLFIAWHQPHVPLEPYSGAQFDVDLGGRRLVVPDRPVDVPVGTIAAWPLHLPVGETEIVWATASALTSLDDTVVLLASDGVPVRLSLPEGHVPMGAGIVADGEAWVCDAAEPEIVAISADGRPVGRLIVIPAEWAERVWVVTTSAGRELVLADGEVTVADGRIRVRSRADDPAARRWDAAVGALAPVPLTALDDPPRTVEVTPDPISDAGPTPDSYGEYIGRASAPSEEQIRTLSARWSLSLPDDLPRETELAVSWRGDVATLVVGDEVVDDAYWDGCEWIVSATDLGLAPACELRVLPLPKGARVHVPEAAAEARAIASDPMIALDRVEIRTYQTWEER